MRRILFLFGFVLFVFSLKAQYNYNKYNYYSVGIKTGPDFYDYSIDKNKLAEVSPNINFSVGVSGAYYVTWFFEVHGSINYSSRNLTLDWLFPPNPDALAVSEYKLHYINIPLEARINALYLNFMKLNFGLGLMPDFRFRPKEFLTYQDGHTEESIKYWGSKNFRSVLIAVPMSMNMKFYLDRHYTIELSGSYYMYLNKMHKDYLDKAGTALALRLGFFYEW
jgi:hypothetical protein